MSESDEVPWIAHLLWLQAGAPDAGPREYHADARWITQRISRAPAASERGPDGVGVKLVWTCACGEDGEIVGAIIDAGRQVLALHAQHAGKGHDVSIRQDSEPEAPVAARAPAGPGRKPRSQTSPKLRP